MGTTQATEIVALTLKINSATHECYFKSLLAACQSYVICLGIRMCYIINVYQKYLLQKFLVMDLKISASADENPGDLV